MPIRQPIKIFCCYAHEDEIFLKQLQAHLRPLQRQGLIDVWHDRNVSAGSEWEREIGENLNRAQIILLLVSSDFMNSDYCYGIEMKRALERHERGEARVLPIILRHTYWQGEPLGKLQALPTDAKPVKSWEDQDEALYKVVEGIRQVAEEISKQLEEQQPSPTERTKEKASDGRIERVMSNQDKSSDSQAIKAQFHQAMIDTYKEAAKIGYRATQFLHMINEKGGVETAHFLLAKEPTEGFTKLWEKNRLDISVEALVLKPHFASLFDKIERDKARKRLAEYRYTAPWDKT